MTVVSAVLSAVLHPRYTKDPMGALWSEYRKFRGWLVVELAVIQAREILGLAPGGAAELIRTHAKIDVAQIETLDRDLKHDMNAFLQQVRESLVGTEAAHLADELHREITSYDVEDPALILLLKEAGGHVLEELRALIASLRTLAGKHRWTLMMARTHGQGARPDTFGRLLLPLVAQLERCVVRIEEAIIRELSEGKISGAIGNYAGRMNPEIEREALKILGLAPAPAETQILGRDRHAAFLSTLADAAAAIASCCETFWVMMHDGVEELREAFGSKQKGSSAMPHKKNPIRIEQLIGMSALVEADAMVAKRMAASQRECRIIHHSCVERHIFPRATALTHYMTITLRDIVDGMVVFHERMQENFDRNWEMWASEDLREALVRVGVNDKLAYHYAQRIAFAARERRVPMSTLCRTEVLSPTGTKEYDADQRTPLQVLGNERLQEAFNPMSLIEQGIRKVFEEMRMPEAA